MCFCSVEILTEMFWPIYRIIKGIAVSGNQPWATNQKMEIMSKREAMTKTIHPKLQSHWLENCLGYDASERHIFHLERLYNWPLVNNSKNLRLYDWIIAKICINDLFRVCNCAFVSHLIEDAIVRAVWRWRRRRSVPAPGRDHDLDVHRGAVVLQQIRQLTLHFSTCV